MGYSESADVETRDFYEAQGCAGDNYYLFVIQRGEQQGSGVSSYFWFETADQLIGSIKAHMDFWDWSNDWEEASQEISNIIEGFTNSSDLPDELLYALDSYAEENAGVTLYAWGTFDSLCSGSDDFSNELRIAFRQTVGNNDESDDVDSSDEARAIDENETEVFLEFLASTPS